VFNHSAWRMNSGHGNVHGNTTHTIAVH